MNIALGVTGCIGAYKAVEILRGLQKRGAAVQVVMTEHATRFVAPLTFQAISARPVVVGMFEPTVDPEIKHIQIAQWCDLLLVAPATANALAKFAHGIADDFLTTLYISTTSQVVVAPAMNSEMWLHPATRENARILRTRGVTFIDPDDGYLACKTVGPGRLAEPEEIVERVVAMIEARIDESRASLQPGNDLIGERVLITAGPTYEAIDPVRGITNRSSGRMGYAIAEAALDRGADVTLVSGPVLFEPPAAANTIRVRSAREMYEAVMNEVKAATLVVMAAAVADYRPIKAEDQKIKKSRGDLILELERTEDILESVGKLGLPQVVVGFAAETEDLIPNALRKLAEKQADLIAANDVSEENSGFDAPTNRVTLVSDDQVEELPLLTKREVADRLLDAALRMRTTATV